MRALISLTILASVGSGAAAAEKETNLSDKPAAVSWADGGELAVLADRLAVHARITRDARAMLVAARIADQIAMKASADKGMLLPRKRTVAVKSAPAVKRGSAADLYAEAKELAAGDPEILAAIAAAQAEASRGVAPPAISHTQYVPAQTVWTVRFNARSGPLVVGARRDTATPVTLKLYDENSNIICQDLSGNVVLYCRVNLIWTGPMRVEMTNLGQYGTGIRFVTNQ